MKQSLKLIFSAVIVTLGATAAYAEKPVIADIPFDFRAVTSNLPAGQYLIGSGAGNPNVTVLKSMDTGKTVFLTSKLTRSESDGHARLIFNCDPNNVCTLATMWREEGAGLDFPIHGFTQRRETVNLLRVKGK